MFDPGFFLLFDSGSWYPTAPGLCVEPVAVYCVRRARQALILALIFGLNYRSIDRSIDLFISLSLSLSSSSVLVLRPGSSRLLCPGTHFLGCFFPSLSLSLSPSFSCCLPLPLNAPVGPRVHDPAASRRCRGVYRRCCACRCAIPERGASPVDAGAGGESGGGRVAMWRMEGWNR